MWVIKRIYLRLCKEFWWLLTHRRIRSSLKLNDTENNFYQFFQQLQCSKIIHMSKTHPNLPDKRLSTIYSHSQNSSHSKKYQTCSTTTIDSNSDTLLKDIQSKKKQTSASVKRKTKIFYQLSIKKHFEDVINIFCCLSIERQWEEEEGKNIHCFMSFLP